MKSRVLARRYAEAFFKVIDGPNLDVIFADFSAFSKTAVEKTLLGDVLGHPTVKLEHKEKLVKLAMENASHPAIANFILLFIQMRKKYLPLFSF